MSPARPKGGGAAAAVLALLALAFGAAPVAAQLRPDPDAPVRDFRLPMFGEDGYRIWELRGTTGLFQSDRTLLVEGMDLRIFGPGGETVERRIRSPRAVLIPDESRAGGDGELLVETDQFELRGEQWSWDGKEHRIVVGREVHTVFFEELGGLLQ